MCMQYFTPCRGNNLTSLYNMQCSNCQAVFGVTEKIAELPATITVKCQRYIYSVFTSYVPTLLGIEEASICVCSLICWPHAGRGQGANT